MSVLGKTSHGLFFNGVTDSIICPSSIDSSSSVKVSSSSRSSGNLVGPTNDSQTNKNVLGHTLDSFSIEAWVLPDCGGVVASKDGLFELSIGSVGAPAPASFSVTVQSDAGKPTTLTASSANANISSGYTGVIYPTPNHSVLTNNTDVDRHTRELLHVAGVFNNNRVILLVNGTVVASIKTESGAHCGYTDSDFYIGGKGGEFRGVIEGVHWKTNADISNVPPMPLVRGIDTLGLWRFEEPVEVDTNLFYLKSAVTAGDTTLTLDATQAQTLYEVVTGQTSTMPTTYTVPSLGDYQVAVTTHSGGSQNVKIPHTTANLLINPTTTDVKTGKPNSKPPERVRLKTINSNGTITVESIHLDFDTDTDTGSRGVLHARTAFDSTNNLAHDSTMVLIKSDLLLDEGTGKPLQPPGLGAQSIDRNGMTVIDESEYGNHGFLFSRRMSINDSGNPYTVSTGNWSPDTKFQVGHSGRHKYSQVTGHPFLRFFPPSDSEELTQTVDGLSDSVIVSYAGSREAIQEQVAVNSEISLHRQTLGYRPIRAITSSKASALVRNGMAGKDNAQDEIIAIGGDGFDVTPFLLKGHGVQAVTKDDDVYTLHLTPETESRVAILETGNNDFPYMEIHYNAIDLTGSSMSMDGPCLLVEKTVPAGGSVFGTGGATVAAKLAGLIGDSNRVLHAPGGAVYFTEKDVGDIGDILLPHRLVGDNTGGQHNEINLDYSRLPTNTLGITAYTPSTATDLPCSPPLAVPSTHASDISHPSVYHHMVVRPTEVKKASGNSHTDDFYKINPKSGNKGDNTQSSHLNEVYDIIDNYMIGNEHVIIIQPTLRSRTMQLKKLYDATHEPTDSSSINIEYLLSRGRVSSFELDRGQMGTTLTMRARGLMDDLSGQSSDFYGKGSDDSTIVKEIRPDAPVVSVTLGGPGQGAVETVPTWDKSPLTRLGWSTGKDGGVEIQSIATTAGAGANNERVVVVPLNNNSPELASWSTYMFPPRGRIYLENGAHMEYKSAETTKFVPFSGGRLGNASFVNKDGTEVDTFDLWVAYNDVKVGDLILLDPLFDESSVVPDGTSINDRLFQSMGGVSHDYQLGTQYASTRALVEIPIFSNQFFDDPEKSIFPGPDNSMKIHIDPTLTAHTWAPNPVGRRPAGRAAMDREAVGPYHQAWSQDKLKVSVTIIGEDVLQQKLEVSNVEDEFLVNETANQFYMSYGDLRNINETNDGTATGTIDASSLILYRRLYRPNGEWAQIGGFDDTTNQLTVVAHSPAFWETSLVGTPVTTGTYMNTTGVNIRDDAELKTAATEFRRPYYYDRANTQTQGGNIDYGLRQYVSAVEFKEGPTANPHAAKIESGAATFTIADASSASATVYTDGASLPRMDTELWSNVTYTAINQDGDEITFTPHANASTINISAGTAADDDVFTLKSMKKTNGVEYSVYDGYAGNSLSFYNTLNRTWNYPYAPGGLRHGDTVWMNMHYTNPHAMEGMFCKSRGVLNEFLVWNGFNGGRGELGSEARSSIPLENFLIGDTCLDTARNFVQHVNKTVELNWLELGNSSESVPVVAYLDPYLAENGHARVLLYDVAHDREFISFHDLHMQVQTGQTTPKVGTGPEGLDVANGFRSQNKFRSLAGSTDKSTFIENAFVHQSSPYLDVTTTGSTHNTFALPKSYIDYGTSLLGSTGRTENTTVTSGDFSNRHKLEALSADLTAGTKYSTFFDTPDGTRAIPAFLCLKGTRSTALDLSSHQESRLDNLPHWTQMDFVRRLTIDLGEVGRAEAVTDVESAAKEIARRVNQAAALQARTQSGSAHDPAPFWDDTAFAGDQGTHMGYLRAHLGRAVTDVNGEDGYTVVIHSTVPGASGRNFCTWLDNSKGQTPYRPQFLVGHGGRFRSFWCMPTEGEDENMHPAPMPITKNGRPFAPITTLVQMVPSDDEDEEFINNLAEADRTHSKVNTEMATGRAANTVYSESFESKGHATRVVNGLRVGTRARSRINFGGLVASGVPGWAPDAGVMGYGPTDKRDRFNEVYGTNSGSYSTYVTDDEQMASKVGNSDLYGFRFTDHRDTDHTIRLIYRQKGQAFANANTTLPLGIENEIIISFDDRDISKGGFTIGKHMGGAKYPTDIFKKYVVTDGGEQYSVGQERSQHSVSPAGGSGFECTVQTVNNGAITSIIVTDEGSGYTAGDVITIEKARPDPLSDPKAEITVQNAPAPTWKGNTWNGIRVPANGYPVHGGTYSSGTLTIVVEQGSGVAGPRGGDLDYLGFLGFPDSGLLIWTDAANTTSTVLRYGSRTHNWSGGTHQFFNVTGGTPDVSGMVTDKVMAVISPMLNWTTLVTDELIAAAVEHAMTVDPNEGATFDCSNMYDPDWRTYEEWMGEASRSAIQIHTLNNKSNVTPLSSLFSVERSPDWGLYAGNAELTLAKGGLGDTHITNGVMADYGYIPRTVLNITTKYRGSNANTATPLLINSAGNAVDTSEWRKHLRGEKYQAYAGDHITPSLNNPIIQVANRLDDSSGDEGLYFSQAENKPRPWLFLPHLPSANANARSFYEPFTLYDKDGEWTRVKIGPYSTHSGTDAWGTAGAVNRNYLISLAQSDDYTSINATTNKPYYSLWTGEEARLFAGHRLAGNTFGEPLTYFRGAHDSSDHSVPLYFGGGFSGVVMDVNDGTQNDYTEFYSHPYTSGPTGCSGLQNVGENMGSFALLDTTAILAMFPGTPYLNQHRGETYPPFSNAEALLAPDLKVGTSSQTMGYLDATDIYGSNLTKTVVTHPTPVVLRFAHPHARFSSATSGSPDEVSYVIFGPGQSVPKHFYGYATATLGKREPAAVNVVSEKFTHVHGNDTVVKSGTENGNHHPNELTKGYKDGSSVYTNRAGNYLPYLPPTMAYQKSAPYPYSILRNWEPATGSPSKWLNDDFDYKSAHTLSTHWKSNTASLKIAHPMNTGGTSAYFYRWGMDSGYPAGGNWFDNAVRKNPPHPLYGTMIPDSQTVTVGSNTVTLGLNASMFRVGSLALTTYDPNLTETGTVRDVFVIDATRVQNSEELGAVISAAINSFPGEGNLKSLGGTFLPSFQDAIRQDRYSWVNVGVLQGSTDADDSTLSVSTTLPNSLPDKGWLRIGDGTNIHYAKYSSYTNAGAFTLTSNHRGGANDSENPALAGNSNSTADLTADTVYVWSKTGNLRWSNGAPEALHDAPSSGNYASKDSVYEHLAATQVHFSGYVDAIDRTRPVGAVGWHGERYSYLNTLKVAKTAGGSHGVSSGLGAWHPLLGFNPYGAGMGCHAMNGATYIANHPDDFNGDGILGSHAGDHDSNATFTQDSTGLMSGLHPRHYVVVSYEGELPIIAKADRDGLILCGDMLDKRWAPYGTGLGGTVVASHDKRHNNDRFVAYANGGPHIDAQFAYNATGTVEFTPPGSGDGEWSANAATTAGMFPMESCLFPTGDLFYDKIENPGVARYPSVNSQEFIRHDQIDSDTLDSQASALQNPYTFWAGNSAARNFFINHAVWKRMDGGNLCMPGPNARGLGAVPWVWRKVGSSYVKFGENIYGNTRFSFETTNSAMFPTIQAQEVAQPHLAGKYPIDVSSALAIPNEEEQFLEITVVDDAGQTHSVEGGSPFGTVIRDFSKVIERGVEGPALAGSGDTPSLSINLPNPDTIPGNIVVRSGFDKIQAYQHESIGTGGLHRPDLPESVVKDNFNSSNEEPSTKPFYENEGWERIDPDEGAWPPLESKSGSLVSEAPLQTSYEPHDRALYFHLTKMGWGYTDREPLGIINNTLTHDPLTLVSVSGTTVTVSSIPKSEIWRAETLPDGRSFFTVNGHLVSFTSIVGLEFRGCKYTPGFSASNGDTLKPSFYVPSGSTRHFAARRLRDHAEVSGESPDKKPIDWMGVGTSASPASAIRSNRLTPMPMPRMGHHYVTPTMAVMPGHLSHPLYQRVYNLNRAYQSATLSVEQSVGTAKVAVSATAAADNSAVDLVGLDGVGNDALMWFSSMSTPHPPSDIHGGGFTLMFETKVKYDGYGILAFDDENNDGDHILRLESGTNYSTSWNFPDPLESGAYQIVIQPNLFAQQLMGFNSNYDHGSDSGNRKPTLTSQQVVTVIGLEWNATTDNYEFVLTEQLPVDVRGCEVYLNEVMLDMDPSPNEQFTSTPPLSLYNPLGINESTSPAWSRKSLPYHPNMFRLATPGYTLTVPWWVPALKTVRVSNDSLDSNILGAKGIYAASNKWRKLAHYYPEDYFHYCRTGYGAVGAQIVMHGYPTHFLDSTLHSYSSLNPVCTVRRIDTANSKTWIEVDNNSLFPEVGLKSFNKKLQITADDGSVLTASYGYRGRASGNSTNTTNKFYDVVGNTRFWSALKVGGRITLTGDYGTLAAGKVYTDKTASVAAYHIEDIKDGTRDTQTGHLPDSYLSMWHYNLGRPMTYYSDTRTNMADAAVDKKPYNHLPEHFETVHYHDFSYVISDGPFTFRGFGPKHANSANSIVKPESMGDTYEAQADPAFTASTLSANQMFHYGAFWPGGSRFGAQASRLDAWGTSGAGWSRNWDHSKIYLHNSGNGSVALNAHPTDVCSTSGSNVNIKRNASFGYRFSIKAPYNKPRAALWASQALLDTAGQQHTGYISGPYTQNDTATGEVYSANNLGNPYVDNQTTMAGYSGMLERVTNASALVGSDLKGQQVRYSHGRRMTRPFGCAVRNFVNDPYVLRNHHGDYVAGAGSRRDLVTKNRRDLALAIGHYMIDWWGNTTGEDVRRAPVRGFGIRPAWDPEDAYSSTDRTKGALVMAAPSQHGHSRTELDFYDPGTTKRVGDRGDGRGVRWPTVFNEDMLQDVDTIMDASGLMLSTHSAEPSVGVGYARPRNDDLQGGEVIQGMSRVLDLHADDGLLKPQAMPGSNVEKETESLLPAGEDLQEPVSRLTPRVGLDSITLSEVQKKPPEDYVIVSTEAHSLHTDRIAGRRYLVAGGVRTKNRTFSDYDLSVLNFTEDSGDPTNVQAMRLNYTHGLWPLGGNLILDISNYVEPISDKGWGLAAGRHAEYLSSNPYETTGHEAHSKNTNTNDMSVKLLVRPVRVLDHRHLEIFREKTNALSSTAGGRYGVFLYDAPSSRAALGTSIYVRSTVVSPTNPPYPPVYNLWADGKTDSDNELNSDQKTYKVPYSVGPIIPGYEASGFTPSLRQSVARITVADNTLQHLRADASRLGDYTVQPRYTQSLYPGSDLNKSDHSGESSHADDRTND